MPNRKIVFIALVLVFTSSVTVNSELIRATPATLPEKLQQSNPTITIGVIAKHNGTVTNGRAYQLKTNIAVNFAKLTIENAGILSGANLNISVKFTDGSPQNISNIITQFYENNVSVIVGPESDEGLEAITPMLSYLNMVVLSYFSSQDVFISIKSPLVYRLRAPHSQEAQAITATLLELGITQVALLTEEKGLYIDEEVAFNQEFLDNGSIVYAHRLQDTEIANKSLLEKRVNEAATTPGTKALVVFGSPRLVTPIGNFTNTNFTDLPVFFARHALEENQFENPNYEFLDKYVGFGDKNPIGSGLDVVLQKQSLNVTAREGFLHDAIVIAAKAIELAQTDRNGSLIASKIESATSSVATDLVMGISDFTNNIATSGIQIYQRQGKESINVGQWSTTMLKLQITDEDLRGYVPPTTKEQPTTSEQKGGFLSYEALSFFFGSGLTLVVVVLSRKRELA